MCEPLAIPATDLQAYLDHKKATPPGPRGAKPTASDVAILFLSTAVKAALQARHLVCGGAGGRERDLPEYAIDILCVSGLVNFPPTEGGPLNYLARNGTESILQQLDQVGVRAALWEEVERLEMRRVLDKVDGLFQVTPRKEGKGKGEEEEETDEEEPKEAKEEEGEEEEEEEEGDYSSQVTSLSAAQLQIIGPTKGLTDMRSLLRPLWSLLCLLLCVLLAVLLIGCSLLGCWWVEHP